LSIYLFILFIYLSFFFFLTSSTVYVDPEALDVLAHLVDGDARAALNSLQMVVEAKGHNPSATVKGHNSSPDGGNADGGNGGSQKTQTRIVTSDDVKESLQRSHVLYDKAGVFMAKK
jgi:putative ATPase